jgi:YD repeat-containing protein
MQYGQGTAQTCSSSTYGVGYSTVTTDEAGNKKQIFTDALGRVIEVDEPNSNNNPTVNTCYTYDALNDLTGVAEGSQSRSYQYDALGRLTQATTPESGTTHYCYTSSSAACATPDTGTQVCSGNPSAVCRRTDARGTTTYYAYDALNRLTSKTYSDATPPVTYAYDQSSVTVNSWSSGTISNPKGRLTSALTTSGSAVTSAVVYSYDSMGRPLHYWQCTPYNCGSSAWAMSYAYDLAGDVSSWTHPVGFTLTNTVSAAQRITQMTSSLSDSTHPPVLAQNITYTPWGAVSGLTNPCLGSGCWQMVETNTYNNRLQPWMMELGIPGNPSINYCLVYNYFSTWTAPTSCPSPSSVPATGSGNNGNVMGYWYQDTTDPTFSHAATYQYDNLNRLTSGVATGSSAYNLAFSYDRYGNMTCVLNGNGTTNHGGFVLRMGRNRPIDSGVRALATG